MVWPGVDGSLRFGRFATSTTANESDVGRRMLRATNLVAADIDKVREALRLRGELQMGGGRGGEEAEDDSVEERKQRREGKVGGGWWSWRRPSKHSQREIAAENAGEVCVSVSDEGCVVSQWPCLPTWTFVSPLNRFPFGSWLSSSYCLRV